VASCFTKIHQPVPAYWREHIWTGTLPVLYIKRVKLVRSRTFG